MSDERHATTVVSDDTVPTVSDWIGLVHRRWRSILVCTVTVTVLLTALTLVFAAAEYEAAATVLVLPPDFSSSLRPGSIGVEGYRTLMESDAVLAETSRKLASEGYPEVADLQTLREHLSSTIFTATRGQPQVLAPLIEAHARAATAQLAQTMAEAWLESFFAASGAMMTDQIDAAISLVKAQYEQKRAQVAEREGERDRVDADFQEQLTAARNDWDEQLASMESEADRDLAEFTGETENLIAAYQVETRDLLRAAADELGSSAEGSPDESAAAASSAAMSWRRLVALRIQLAQTQQFLSLARSITDEALWEAQVSNAMGETIPRGIIDQRLMSQELNPAYAELSLQVADVEIALEAIDLDAQHRTTLRSAAQQLEAMQRERSAGLTSMLAMRNAEARRMRAEQDVMIRGETRRHQENIDAIVRQRDRALAMLARDIEQTTKRLQQLAEPYEEAQLAAEQRETVDVTLASPVSSSPGQRPGLVFILLAGLFFGAVLGLLVAVFRDSR